MAMDHVVPPVPKWIRILRYVQFAITILYVGLIAGSIVLISPFYYTGQAFGLFAAGFSLILHLYLLITHNCAKGGYLKWFHLGWESLATLFWLCALGNTASLAAYWGATSSYYRLNDDGSIRAEHALLAVSAFLSGIQWVFFMLTLIFFSIGCHHCRMGRVDADGNLMKPGDMEMKHDSPNPPASQNYAGVQPIHTPAPHYQNYTADPTGNYYPPTSTVPHQQPSHMPAGL